jgi:hypothetical protein
MRCFDDVTRVFVVEMRLFWEGRMVREPPAAIFFEPKKQV